MPSSTPRLPGGYPYHWEAALRFLSTAKIGTEVCVETGLSGPQANTAHTKARAMRISCQRNAQWGPAICQLARNGELAFRVETTARGNNLYFRKKFGKVELPL